MSRTCVYKITANISGGVRCARTQDLTHSKSSNNSKTCNCMVTYGGPYRRRGGTEKSILSSSYRRFTHETAQQFSQTCNSGRHADAISDTNDAADSFPSEASIDRISQYARNTRLDPQHLGPRRILTDTLDITQTPKALLATKSTVTASTPASERHGADVESSKIIDCHISCSDVADALVCIRGVVTEYSSSEGVHCRIGDLDRVVY